MSKCTGLSLRGLSFLYLIAQLNPGVSYIRVCSRYCSDKSVISPEGTDKQVRLRHTTSHDAVLPPYSLSFAADAGEMNGSHKNCVKGETFDHDVYEGGGRISGNKNIIFISISNDIIIWCYLWYKGKSLKNLGVCVSFSSKPFGVIFQIKLLR